MNLVPSDLPRVPGAASVSKPDFDIILAVSSARQAALPTVRMLRRRALSDSRRARLNALCEILGGNVGGSHDASRPPVRFFDLSDEANGLAETMNGPFTRGFQPMLNPSGIDPRPSVEPIPPVEDKME